MNKNKNKKVKVFMKAIIIFGISTGVMILALTILLLRETGDLHKETDEERLARGEQLRQMIIEHLESKYNKKFIVGSDWYGTGPGSPIPGMVDNSPSYCEAYSEDDPNYVFRAFIYQELKEDIRKEIRDGYCWKFLKEEIRKEFDDRVKKIIPGGYKLVIEVDSDVSFNNDLSPDSPLTSYFDPGNEKLQLILNLVLTAEDKNDQEILKGKLDKELKKIYKEYSKNMFMEFVCYKAKNPQDFNELNEKN